MNGTPAKEYERRIVDAAHGLRAVTDDSFDRFVLLRFKKERTTLAMAFRQKLLSLKVEDTRQFRLRYRLAKLTQHREAHPLSETMLQKSGTRGLYASARDTKYKSVVG